ncbi:autotransporter domain-containing protein [Rickettsia typhi]|uniref:Cell surface antigen Sca3 n=1 Tax=Rickettsia typhi (strain ATCC VR-144 / Wilmington) TaxID=257363 RepID=Q68WS7_RICTY|nr:autotransporter outer membrane beta-barrel domain-containing protein [Rickettsia typhi]AAU03915.1 cell surface antigen Sca3 [Rickettsia typhi str. Wilmington]
MKKSKILRKFLATASLCGTLFTNSNATGAIIPNSGSVSLNTGAGLVGGVFQNGDIIQIVNGGREIKISADKANAVIGGISALRELPDFGGVEVSQNVSIGPLSAGENLNTNFGPLKFISNNVTSIITGVDTQTFSNIDFAGKNATLQINKDLNITTKIDNTVAGNNGTITFEGSGVISNHIGFTNSLLGINVGNGEAKIDASRANNITINAKNINLTHNNSIFTLCDCNITTLKGNINNTTGIDGQGILNLAYDPDSSNIITGDICNIGSLDTINVLRGSATLNSTIVKATNINLQHDTATLNLGDNIIVIGNIKGINNEEERLNLKVNDQIDNEMIIPINKGMSGKLNLQGNATLNGNIDNLRILKFSGGHDKILNLQGNTEVEHIIFEDSILNSGTITVNGLLNTHVVTFNKSNANGGTLIINAKNTISASLLNAIKAKIQINANLTINHPSAGHIGDIRIADNTTYTINADIGHVNLLQNGAKIMFEGADAMLALINTSFTDRTFTIYNNLNQSGNDEYGIVKIEAITKGITISNHSEPYTIGQDNTHRLKELIVEGGGNIIVDNTVFTKLLSINSTGQITFNRTLDLGAGGNIAFGKNGTLVVHGVAGSITTSENNQGILTINSGNVTGTIGANGLGLKLVNIGAGSVTCSANVFAPVALTNPSSILILADGVTLTGTVTTHNNTKGILSLGIGSNVTGLIGENNATLEKINIGAGASNIDNNIYAGSMVLTDKTSELILNTNVVVNGNITTIAGNNSGKLVFTGNGDITGNIGANGAALQEVVFNGTTNIGGTANSQNFTVAHSEANVVITGLTTGSLKYKDTGTIIANGGLVGDIDFNNKAGKFILGDGTTIDGSVLCTGGIAGTLHFIGDGNVTQNIGSDTENSISTINIQGDNTKNVTITNDIFVNNIYFTNGGVLQLGGNLTTHNIDFGANGGTLEFNGNNTYNLNAIIVNGQNGILNAFTNLKATDDTIGTVKIINIGQIGTPQNFTIQVNNKNLTLVSNINSSINFCDSNSQLILSAPVDQTIKFINNLNGTGGGIITLDGNGNNLTISGNNGIKLGSRDNELSSLNIKGKVTVTHNLDVQNIHQLNINNGAFFNDHSLTSAKIKNINIGEETGEATYTLDAINCDFDLNTSGMVFKHQDSVLELKNSSNTNDRIITLTSVLDPGNGQSGIIKLITDTNKLTIDNNGNVAYTLGTANHMLKQLTFTSINNGAIALKVGINVENITLNIKDIELNEVNANVLFNKNVTYTATGNINGHVDFQGNAGVINLDDGIKIDGSVTSTNDVNGTLNLNGSGEVTGLITNIAMLQAGAGDVSLSASGNYSITEIQGNGNNNLTFAANSHLTTDINKTDGQAVNLVFINGGSVSGSVGLSKAVGDIIIHAGNVTFNNTVKSSNVVISDGSTMQVNNNITANDISGKNINNGTLKLNNHTPIIITSTLGHNNSIGTIEVANNDVTITGALKAQNIHFSNAAQETTLTLGAASQVTNITTAGNNIHTLEITDLDTGNDGTIGTENNRLKSIELTGNGTITINSKHVYSSITTANNEQGNVKLNIEGGIAYDLGSEIRSLANVQISEDSTVKGDVYSKYLNIDAGKTINFDRGDNNMNPKNLDIPDAIIDLDVLPRSLSLFNYFTDIKADNLNFVDGTATANFKDAVVIDARIDNGGTLKFNNNVWLTQEIKNANSIEIASNKFMLLQKNIKAATLIADKANLVLLDNVEINTNLNVRDIVLDLANYELKYTGNVTHNGLLTIITYFDTALQKGGHILVGQGSNVDMSDLDNLIIKIKSRSDITNITSDTKHQVVKLEAGAIYNPVPQTKVIIDASGEQNKFVKWVTDANGFVLLTNTDTIGQNNTDNGSLDNGYVGNSSNNNSSNGVVGPSKDKDHGITDIAPIFDPSPILDYTKNNYVASSIANQLINHVKGFGNTTDAGKLLNDLGFMLPNRVTETLDRLSHRTNINGLNEGVAGLNGIEIENFLTDIAINMDNFTAEGIGNRLEELIDAGTVNGLNRTNASLNNNNLNLRRLAANNQTVIAAGDEDNTVTGIWGMSFYSKIKQNSKNSASGYQSNTGGGIIGFDYNIDNSIVIGAAYTMADSKVKHKNDKSGDKTKAKSNIYSIYGLYHWLNNNFFVEAIGVYGRNKIKNYEKRITAITDQTAIGKFINTFYSYELLGGYNYLVSNRTTITPMFGIRYTTLKNNSYKENNTTFQNLSIKKNYHDKFETILGLNGATHYLAQDIIIKPELHWFINYQYKNKLPNIDARLDGIDEPLTTIRFKSAKITYNLGGGISTKNNMIEFGIRYNLSLAKKYTAHQGSLKIKVKL